MKNAVWKRFSTAMGSADPVMAIWFVLLGISAFAIVLLVAPLWRRPKQNQSRNAFDAQIYRDQLEEIERDAERGQISPEQAASARTEIARRLLAITDGDSSATVSAERHMTEQGVRDAAHAARRGIAVFVGLAVPMAAFGVYLIVGSPHLPSRPAAEIRAQAPVKKPAAGTDTARLVAELGRRLQDRPTDIKGWTLYARTLASLGRFGEAEAAYQRVTTLAPEDAELMSRYAEVQIFAAEGTVTPAARASLDATLALDAKEPRARYYLGLAQSQAGRFGEALTVWISLESESGPDAPWSGLLGERISRLAKQSGMSPDDLAARRNQAAARAGTAKMADAPRGPTAEDVKAAQSMSKADRMEMIRGMVAGLSERLKSNPEDLAGWQRLARSYDVLGEAEKARDAYGHIAKLRPDDTDALASYAAAIARALPRDAQIPGELLELGDRILTLDPRHTGALWFTGMALAEAGDRAGARERWTRLLAELDPDSPQYADVKKSIEALDKTGP